jgi:hypothetical protein
VSFESKKYLTKVMVPKICLRTFLILIWSHIFIVFSTYFICCSLLYSNKINNTYFVNQNHRHFVDARGIFVRIRVCMYLINKACISLEQYNCIQVGLSVWTILFLAKVPYFKTGQSNLPNVTYVKSG